MHTPGSLASDACTREREVAASRGIPVLTVRLEGEVPPPLRTRLYLDIENLRGSALTQVLAQLATIVYDRAVLRRTLEEIESSPDPESNRRAARHLFDAIDATLLAESLDSLARLYRPETDVMTRFWLALAVGKAGTCAAKTTLQRMSWERDPYPREGLRRAQEMLSALECKETIR